MFYEKGLDGTDCLQDGCSDIVINNFYDNNIEGKKITSMFSEFRGKREQPTVHLIFRVQTADVGDKKLGVFWVFILDKTKMIQNGGLTMVYNDDSERLSTVDYFNAYDNVVKTYGKLVPIKTAPKYKAKKDAVRKMVVSVDGTWTLREPAGNVLNQTSFEELYARTYLSHVGLGPEALKIYEGIVCFGANKKLQTMIDEKTGAKGLWKILLGNMENREEAQEFLSKHLKNDGHFDSEGVGIILNDIAGAEAVLTKFKEDHSVIHTKFIPNKKEEGVLCDVTKITKAILNRSNWLEFGFTDKKEIDELNKSHKKNIADMAETKAVHLLNEHKALSGAQGNEEKVFIKKLAEDILKKATPDPKDDSISKALKIIEKSHPGARALCRVGYQKIVNNKFVFNEKKKLSETLEMFEKQKRELENAQKEIEDKNKRLVELIREKNELEVKSVTASSEDERMTNLRKRKTVSDKIDNLKRRKLN